MPCLYRKEPDSSGLLGPRLLARVFVEPGAFGRAVHSYEELTGAALDMDLDAREFGIRIGAVGSFLILEVNETVMPADRVQLARQTPVTLIFADLDDGVEIARSFGAEVVTPAAASLVGRAAFLRHPDGLLVEYLEHRPSAHDAATPGDLDAGDGPVQTTQK